MATNTPITIVKNFKCPSESIRGWVERYKQLNHGWAPSVDEINEAGFYSLYVKIPRSESIQSSTDAMAAWCKENVPQADYIFKFFAQHVVISFTLVSYAVALKLILSETLVDHEIETN